MISPANRADLAAVAALEQRAFGPDAWTADQLAEEIDHPGPGRGLLLARVGGEVRGYVIWRVSAETADLMRIVIHPDDRQRGRARALLTAALVAAGECGADRMLLEVAAVNAPARRLYAAAGFTLLARRRRYYRDGSDALVLARRIPRTAGEFVT